jgi:hypothetical protein
MELSMRLARVVAVVTSVLFLILNLLAARNSAIEYDEAYQASVAKNLGLGFGYVTSYKTFVPFNPDTTTGPGLLLPMAVLIRLLGNQYWVPGATNALISFAIFGSLFILLPNAIDWKSLSKEGRLAAVFSTPLFLSLCLGAGIIGFFSVGLGETGAAGFVLLGQLALAFATVHKDKLTTQILTAAGGLFLGLSLWFKLIVLLQVVPTLVVFPLIMFWQNNWIRGIQSFLLSAIPCALPSLAFCLIAGTSLNYWDQVNVFVNKGSGLNHLYLSFSDQVVLIRSNICQNTGIIFETLTDWFAGCFFAVVMVCGLIGLFFRLKEQVFLPKTPSAASDGMAVLDNFFLYVLAGAASGFGWWLCFSDVGWIRHLLPSLLAVLLFISLSPAISPNQFSSTALWFAIIAIFIQFASHARRFESVPSGYNFPPSDTTIMPTYSGLRLEPFDRVSDQVALAGYLADLLRADPKARLYGCDWWVVRSAEYLLPTAGNFHEIYSRDFADHPFPSYHRYLVIDHKYWTNWGYPAAAMVDAIWCKRSELVFSKGDYFVYRCP